MSSDLANERSAEFLTIAQAAKLLSCGTRPLYRAVKLGQLRAATINERGDLRTTRQALEDFLARRVVRA